LTDFVAAIITPGRQNVFLADFLKFQRKIAYFGMLNGLAQVLLKLTTPGVPDLYQGCELWDLRLVDPDNRGPVDFDRRAQLLEAIEKRGNASPSGTCKELTRDWADGRAKLYLVWKMLNLRRQYHQLFLDGSFVPLPAGGKHANNLIAFARHQGNKWTLTIVPRWLADAGAPVAWARMTAFWRGTKISLPPKAPSRWKNVLSGEVIELAPGRKSSTLRAEEVLGNFPVACLKALSG
jgi:(1->4)-alpha-D-glucan 1-alpha-D-glucosylmutase